MKARLQADLQTAQKNKDALKLNTIRGIRSGIKYKEIEAKRELDDDEIVSLIASQIKKNKEAAELFQKGKRLDLSEKELLEVEILQNYLPEQVSEEELRARIQVIIDESGAASAKDLGKVMKIAIPEFKGKADSAAIKSLALEFLNG
ncbi:MAG: GatB/YqeY domain-containing protein [Candidatus Nitrohelix vancouverensis]|uniref:GatB/YqeY domain-containing protein n=1 Tax=Candidatus Nitrohelix vancouverensis TaxID=2705534 RepID=A0A7T0C5Q6_9BACT|nr:MAG: GatB/YqeY domain-containing protein [Candidatus Nitrohelix vancouverensis]